MKESTKKKINEYNEEIRKLIDAWERFYKEASFYDLSVEGTRLYLNQIKEKIENLQSKIIEETSNE